MIKEVSTKWLSAFIKCHGHFNVIKSQRVEITFSSILSISSISSLYRISKYLTSLVWKYLRQDGQLVFVSRWQKCYFCKEFDKQVFNKTYQGTYLMRHQFALICYIQNNWLWYLNFYVMMVEKCSMTLMYKLCIFLKINNWSNNKIILLLLSIFKILIGSTDQQTEPFYDTFCLLTHQF